MVRAERRELAARSRCPSAMAKRCLPACIHKLFVCCWAQSATTSRAGDMELVSQTTAMAFHLSKMHVDAENPERRAHLTRANVTPGNANPNSTPKADEGVWNPGL